MPDLVLKRRTAVRAKDQKQIIAWMQDEWGVGTVPGSQLETGSLEGRTAYVLDNRIVAYEEQGRMVLTLRGIMALNPSKRWVVVDMGAVPYLANGADVMGPGIVDASPEIEKDDLVYVMDVRNRRPLCVGRALISGKEMLEKRPGKTIKSLHHVGDDIWNATI